ncbi:MAG TPA: NADH-quinone oxidoreductase subunit N, partial [Dehalococcoidia bacterium]|nr:NADH-quinone oxidoreductase subunit N [Dehalococcoidia bacterium]
MTALTENLYLLTPEFALAGLAFLVFAVDLFLPGDRKDLLGWLSIAGLLGLIVLSLVMLPGQRESLYGGLLAIDDFSLFFKVVFLGLGVFIVFSSIEYVKQHLSHPGEFYGLLLFSILGMNIMAQSRELLTAYIALELLSFSLYVMVAYALANPKSNEASVKYIIIGAFSSAILLYGISMVYSTLGVTRFADISVSLNSVTQVSPALWAGLALIVVGLGFKLSAVPFHMWAPDTYEGAPLPVTAYLAIGSKTAAFALLLRLAAEGLVPASDRWEQWQIILAVLAALTMIVGNLVALAQRNIKRLMAYSSIGHVGFVLAGIAALSSGSLLAANAVTFYLVGYAITNMVVFAALISYYNKTGQEEIADFAGMADRQPFLAA